MSVRLSSLQDYATLLDKYDTWMFDCDGVLWHGDRLIDGVVEVLELLRRKSELFMFLFLIGIIYSDKDIWRLFCFATKRRTFSLYPITPLNQGGATRANLTSWGCKHMW